MPIEPESKNWTWVIEQACPDCGFNAPATDPLAVGALVRQQLEEWRSLLNDPCASQRPDDGTWSALEYGCHVRDVFQIFERRLHRMLVEDGPTFANWDQDATATDERYDLQDPLTVAEDLIRYGERIAARFATVHRSDLARTGARSDGSEFTIDTFARYFLHDPVHHLWDVRQGYERVSRS